MNLVEHAEHKWSQQGRCVYCDTCNMRLYQGKLPAPGKQKEEALGIDAILDPIRKKLEAKAKQEWEERTPEQHKAWEDGRASYTPGASIMDRMRGPRPYKGTDLEGWFNQGWTNAEFAYYEEQRGD